MVIERSDIRHSRDATFDSVHKTYTCIGPTPIIMGLSIKPILGLTPINTAQGSRSLHGEQTIQFAFIPKKRDANQVDQIRGRIKYQRSISPKSIAKRDLLITVARLPLCLSLYM